MLGCFMRIARVASSPFNSGIPISRITISGDSAWVFSTTSRPFVASPQISMSGCDSSRDRRPRSTTA